MTPGHGRAWIDGAARGNPGDAAFGVLLTWAGGSEEIGGYLGRTTNNVAEWTALLALLTRARALGLSRLAVGCDSELVVKQFSGAYRVKAAHLVPLYREAMALRRAFAGLRLEHVPREENRAADRIANRAIDERWPLPDWLERRALAAG